MWNIMIQMNMHHMKLILLMTTNASINLMGYLMGLLILYGANIIILAITIYPFIYLSSASPSFELANLNLALVMLTVCV